MADSTRVLGTHMDTELRSQPETWRRAIEQAGAEQLAPTRGERVAVVGCGTSWYMAMAYAAARESAGHGVTDAFVASEAWPLLDGTRDYDRVVAITRSGTTSEVLDLLRRLERRIPTVVVLGALDTPVAQLADAVIALPYADEESVVQTRFATTTLAYLFTTLGIDVRPAIADAETALNEPVGQDLLDAEQFSFLGRGLAYPLALEAALKAREAVQGWTEAYPAMDYRHGPIAIGAPGRVTWMIGETPSGLADEVRATGATFVESSAHPLAELARIHLVTLERARVRGLDPDHPRSLSRSVVLE